MLAIFEIYFLIVFFCSSRWGKVSTSKFMIIACLKSNLTKENLEMIESCCSVEGPMFLFPPTPPLLSEYNHLPIYHLKICEPPTSILCHYPDLRNFFLTQFICYICFYILSHQWRTLFPLHYCWILTENQT